MLHVADPTRQVPGGVLHVTQHQLGASMRPKAVLFVTDLPKTRNAKIMRRVIRAAFLGIPTGDLTSLENPAAVEEIADLGSKKR